MPPVRPGLLLLAVLLLAGCGASAKANKIEVPPTPKRTFAGAPLTPPRVAPPLALHDAWGRRVSLSSLRGRFVLVTFLYVHCPDVCPLIAQNLNATLEQLGSKRDRVRVLAVSVDPKGDTPTAVRRYIAQRHLVSQFRYLLGTRAQLTRTWAAWHVLSLRTKPDVVDHVAYTALVDPSGKERLLYDSKVKAAEVLHDLRLLMSA